MRVSQDDKQHVDVDREEDAGANSALPQAIVHCVCALKIISPYSMIQPKNYV